MHLRDHYVADPTAFALQTMGNTAQQAAETWTVQEWAGKLAARAAPRDYVGQLRELYADILKRWRYVQEQGERVPGTANAVLGHVLGASYNLGAHCQSPEHCDVLRTPWNQRGFGDCDDVSTVVAAGALAMGMRPLFRVARWPGGAHVSTMVETPKGERVSLDPVGEPEHGFGWALNPQGGAVELVDVHGRAASAMGAIGMSYHHPTTLSGLPMHRRTGPEQFDSPHWVLTRAGDTRGPRVLAIPTRTAHVMRRGYVIDGANAVDQFGDVYSYMRGADVWAPIGCTVSPMGRWRLFGGRTKFGRRLRKAGRKIRRAATKVISRIRSSKIVKFAQKAKARILRSKLVQTVAARALQAFGVPPQVTKAIMQREAALAKRGGRLAMAEAISRGNYREAAKIAASSMKEGISHGIKQLVPGGGGGFSLPMGSMQYVAPAFDAMRGWEDDPHELELIAEDGLAYPVAPVAGFEALGGWNDLGALNITTEPELGKWYRVVTGDTFFGVVRRAMGPNATNQEVTKQAQLINSLAYNTRFHVNAPQGELNFWKRRISFTPKFTELPENQAQNPKTGGKGNAFPVIYLTATGEDPPPFEDPIEPPDPEIDEPTDPDPDPVVVPPEEPPPVEPPVEPPPPPVEPPPPVMPPVEPPPPPIVVPPEPLLPPVLPPPPPVLPPPPPVLPPPVVPPPVVPDYTVPDCPPGHAYDYTLQRCVDVRPPPPEIVEPRWPVEPPPPPVVVDPEPITPVEPPRQVPTQPPAGGGFPWLLVAMVGGMAVGVPAPMIAAAGLLVTRREPEIAVDPNRGRW